VKEIFENEDDDDSLVPKVKRSSLLQKIKAL
jgi:hypothetical protein